ncbi:MAG: hypothetical protein H5U36_09940 [Candidatus Caldatribacterium sp.]|nr:hypothetical protein [Candidatus Caldatribacterium sp.]
MFIFCCGECYEYKGLPLVCPRCGKKLRLPRNVETLGTLEKGEEENLIDCSPTHPPKDK